MKKLFLAFFFLLGLLAVVSSASAQTYKDVVQLKNGGVVRGMIIEQVPNVSIKIQTTDGNVFVFKMSEVAKISKEGAVSPTISGGNPGASRKDPAVAFILSFLICPGLGQFYNGQAGKGAAMLVLAVGGLVVGVANAPHTVWVDDSYYYWDGYEYYWVDDGYYKNEGNAGACAAGLLVFFGTWIWSFVDAPLSANQINQRNGIALYENMKKNTELAIEPTMFNNDSPRTGAKLAYRF